MSRLNRNTLKYSIATPLLTSFMLLLGTSQNAMALPQQGTVVAGQAGITSTTKTMDVNQSTARAVVNWSSFDIAADERVKFIQPSAQSVTLNRVTGSQSASQILGKLDANGQLMLINPQGVVFGAGSQVNVGGLIATTSNIDDNRFMAGDYTFDHAGNADATIANHGEIKVADGGLVALVGANVTNDGLIEAKLGKVQLASGDTFAIDLYGDGLLKLQASDTLTKQLVNNSGKIIADGGNILMTAAAAKNSVDSLINMDGLLQANSVGVKNGHVVLQADAGTTLVSGSINAQGLNANEKGGAVDVLGKNVGILSDASVDVSGQNGGGTIRVGGDFHGEGTTKTATRTIVQSNSSLKANAIANGNGGNVTVWADDTTVFAGNIEAKAGANGGNGGFVETSGKNVLQSTGLVNASAAKGLAGSWLLDPNNITISNIASGSNVTGNPNFTTTDVDAIVTTNSIEQNLNNGTNVTITTGNANPKNTTNSGDIFVYYSIAKTAGNDATLTLNAQNNILFASGVTISSKSNKLNVFLNADFDANGNGLIALNQGSSIFSNGGQISLGGHNSVAGHSNAAAAGVQIFGDSNSHTILDAAGGDITIYSSSNAALGWGLYMRNADIKTSGSGSIDIVAAGASLSGLSTSGNYGADIGSSTITNTGSGNISITGIGGNSTTRMSDKNYGLALSGVTVQSTGTGNVSLTGQGGAVTSGITGLPVNSIAAGYGIGVGNSSILSTGGNVTIKGIGASGNALNTDYTTGIIFGTNNTVAAEGNGSVTVTGVYGAHGVAATNEGVGLNFFYNNTFGGSSSTGLISFVADSIGGGSNSLNVVTKGKVAFNTYTSGLGMVVGNKPYVQAVSKLSTMALAAQPVPPAPPVMPLYVAPLQISSNILNSIQASEITFGSLTGGSITANAHSWNSAVSFLSGSSINISGAQTLGANTFLAQSDNSVVIIGSNGSISSSAAGNAITLSAKSGAFLNFAGANALTTTADGRWLIYSANPAADQLNGLQSDFHRYSCVLNGSCPSFPVTGNGSLYSFTPILTVAADASTTAYGQDANYAYKTSGYLFNDQTIDVLTGLPVYTTNYVKGNNAGSYSVGLTSTGSLASALGYGFAADTTVLLTGLTVTPASSIPMDLIDASSIQGEIHAANFRAPGYNGVLLAVSNVPRGGLAGLTPAAGGTASPADLASLSPAAGGSQPMSTMDLASLSPAAGGMGSPVSLIECNSDTPCQINQ